jgi:hypothetical protein
LKYAQRLDDARLAEVLNERGMADLDSIREMLQAAQAGGTSFCEAVVSANLVSDWDLSRVVAELFQLPFLPVDIASPDEKLWEEIQSPTLRENALVPLRRFGQVLTVAMPGLVPADVLGLLAAETDYFLLPVVGTVETNRRWIAEHGSQGGDQGGDWGSIFDEGDAAVQATLDDEPVDGLVGVEDDLDLSALEFTSPEGESGIEPPSLVVDPEPEQQARPEASGPVDLPPTPNFE